MAKENLTKTGVNTVIQTDDPSAFNTSLKNQGWSATTSQANVPQGLDPMLRMEGLTFYKDFTKANNMLADFAVGSNVITFARSACPCTYIDSSGILQEVTAADVPRITQGYYDSTGFNSQPEIMIEGASTNLLTHGIFDAGTTQATGWALDEDESSTLTKSLVDVTSDLMNISGAQAQRIEVTFSDGTYIDYKSDVTAVGTFAQNDYATISFWLKGTVGSNIELKLSIREYDAAGVGGTIHSSADIAGSLSTTEWRRFTYSVQLTDADLSRAKAFIGLRNPVASDVVDLYIAGAQLEELPLASSLTPTTSAAVTRNADVVSAKTSGNRTAAQESCVVRLAPYFKDSVTTASAYISDTATKRRTFLFTSGANDVQFSPNGTDSAGTNVTDLINDSWSANQSMVLGYSVQSTGNPNAAGYYNGSADGTNDNDDFTSPAWGTNFYIGTWSGGTAQLFGGIKAIAFFDRVLSSAEHAYIASII